MTCSRCRREIEPGTPTEPTTDAGMLCGSCADDAASPWWERIRRLFATDPDAEEVVN